MILPYQYDAAKSALRRVVVEGDTWIAEECRQATLVIEHVADRFTQPTLR